jgi:hypothetical protein
MVTRFIYSSADQPSSRAQMRVSQRVAGWSDFATSIRHRQNIGAAVAFRTIDDFVICLPRLLPLEPKLVGMAKNCSANSP